MDDAAVRGLRDRGRVEPRYRYLLSQGVSGLSVAFDLPTQIGYDSRSPAGRRRGRARRRGDRFDRRHGGALRRHPARPRVDVDDHQRDGDHPAGAVRRGRPSGRAWRRRQLSGTIQNDILKEYIARGTYIYPPQASLRIVTDIFAFCEREVPQWNTISISGYHIREAGSTAVQEVAFTFANAIAYVEAARDAGLDVNAFGQRLSFFFNAHNDFLEEVAKFRAARRLWARIMRDRFGATNPRAQQLRFHTQTAGSTLTAQQPDNNIVRVAVQALAAVLGGTQSLHTNGRDEALALPTEDAARIALRTQQIIGYESGVANTVDPFAGLVSHREADQRDRGRRARAADAHRRDRRHAGGDRSGLHPAPDAGLGLQGAAGDRHGRRRRRRRQPLRQTGRPGAHRGVPARSGARSAAGGNGCDGCGESRRPAAVAGRARRASRARRRTTDNLVPPIIAAVEAHATVGEIADTLRGVFGEYREVSLD